MNINKPDNKTIVIRKLDPAHWQQYRDLRLQAVQEAPWAFARSYAEELQITQDEWVRRLELSLQPNHNVMLFAQNHEKLIGMVGALVGLSERNKHVAKVVSVYVIPEFRRSGIATHLMEELLHELKKNPNIIKVTLEASKDAVTLYKRVGFQQLCVLKKEHYANGNYYDQTLMEQFI